MAWYGNRKLKWQIELKLICRSHRIASIIILYEIILGISCNLQPYLVAKLIFHFPLNSQNCASMKLQSPFGFSLFWKNSNVLWWEYDAEIYAFYRTQRCDATDTIESMAAGKKIHFKCRMQQPKPDKIAGYKSKGIKTEWKKHKWSWNTCTHFHTYIVPQMTHSALCSLFTHKLLLVLVSLSVCAMWMWTTSDKYTSWFGTYKNEKKKYFHIDRKNKLLSFLIEFLFLPNRNTKANASHKTIQMHITHPHRQKNAKWK